MLYAKYYYPVLCLLSDDPAGLNSLPNDKILDWSKLEAFADDKLNAIEKLKYVLGLVENMVEKGENAGFQHFLIFPLWFQKSNLPGSLKVGMYGKELNTLSAISFNPFSHLSLYQTIPGFRP